MTKKRITLGIVAAVLGAWAIFPDPLFFTFVDDIVAGLGSAISLLTLIKDFTNKNT